MEHPLLIFTILNLALVATHAALPPELYWKSVLPTTPMPKAIADILRSAALPPELYWKSVHPTTPMPKAITDILHPGKERSTKWKPMGAAVRPSALLYVTETQLNIDPNVAVFFFKKDLHPGAKFNLQFTTKSSSNAAFSPRQVADSIPFSSHKVQDIFNEFSIQPGSLEAQVIQNTIKECEAPAIRGEEKYCATSLESMVDFSISKLGKDVEVVSTEVDKETKLQEYTIAPGVKKTSWDKAVVCHEQDYPYAVFYCHKTETTRGFNVPLEGSDGTRVKALAVCHSDTSQWNPKHLAFQVLKVKPGTPVCHFLPQDHVVWVPK